MGLAASQARALMLTAWQSDLEFKIQGICTQRLKISMKVSKLSEAMSAAYSNEDVVPTGYGNYSGKNVSALESMLAQLQAEDKIYEMNQKTAETTQKAVNTERDSVDKVIENNIKRSFKTFGGG